MTVTEKQCRDASARPASAPATILVVDDDPAMRTILDFSLRNLGYFVLTAGDGEDALQITRAHPEIRLIMLDVVMSGLSGKKLAVQLKANLPQSPILFCSGHVATAMSLYDIDLRVEQFLQKPCRPPELKSKLEEMLTTS
jgi:CheY-like chemotaxis protein